MDELEEEIKESMNSTLPEAPVSITVRGYYKGFSVLITKRNAKGSVELEKIIEAIDNMVDEGFKPSWNEQTNGKQAEKPATRTFVCNKCGGEAEYVEGVSKKTGKPFKGIFCKDDSCGNVKFI